MPSVPMACLPLLRAALKLIQTSDTPTANAEQLSKILDLDEPTVQHQLTQIEHLFNQVLHGDDKIISIAQPTPAALQAATSR